MRRAATQQHQYGKPHRVGRWHLLADAGTAAVASAIGPAGLTCLGFMLAISLFGRPAAANSPTPGGKKYYVVAVASASQARVAQVTFFASLDGTYYGDVAGRVSWGGWYWDKDITGDTPGSSSPVGAGTWVAEDCDQTGKYRRYSPNGAWFNNGLPYQQGAHGELRTAYSFTGNQTEQKAGDFYIVAEDPSFVHIRWDDGSWEDWDITTADVGIQKLELRNSNLGYQDGLAAGSNSDFSVRVHPQNTLSNPVNAGFTQCTNATWVLNIDNYYDSDRSNCSCKPKRSYKNGWRWRISSTDRRDARHLWCHCLTEGDVGPGGVRGIWYNGGSHQYPLLQAVDDFGNFRGYVGVGAEPRAVNVQRNLLDF